LAGATRWQRKTISFLQSLRNTFLLATDLHFENLNVFDARGLFILDSFSISDIGQISTIIKIFEIHLLIVLSLSSHRLSSTWVLKKNNKYHNCYLFLLPSPHPHTPVNIYYFLFESLTLAWSLCLKKLNFQLLHRCFFVSLHKEISEF
jgi:hypothetical protein